MKFSAPYLLIGTLFITGAADVLRAQATLSTPPANSVLTPPSQSANDAKPTPVPSLPEIKLVAQFDRNGDQQLDAVERQAARAFLAQHPPPELDHAVGRPSQRHLPNVALESTKPGEKLALDRVDTFDGQPPYDPKTLRTLFLDFEDADWEQELADFSRTDVRVPARLRVDKQTLAGVGVHFRPQPGQVPFGTGYKRSLDLALDYSVAGQQFKGQRQLRLVACASDPTFLRSMLYYRVAREYLPTPQANFVRVVINGENWGIYVSVEPFDENFVQANFGAQPGARWMVVPGGNLAYLGEDSAAYRNLYRLQSADNPAAWSALIKLCRTLNQTPSDQLEAALTPFVDLDSLFKFLALENAFINQDGYGSPTGCYGLYLDPAGRFHFVPYDAESSFRLVQVSEFDKHARGTGAERGGRREGGGKDSGRAADKTKEPTKAKEQSYTPQNFPHQSSTDLAMLLSYSLINKADADLDEKVTRDEWLTFARVWFTVMDEDLTGRLSREQFIGKVRTMITPPSIADGRTRQTFGQVDAAAAIGQDLFNAIDISHDGQLTQEELTGAFGRWFTAWANPKSGQLTQDALLRGLNGILTKSVFEADKTYIAVKPGPHPEEEEQGKVERGGQGGRHGSGSGASMGPLHLGLPSFGGRGGGNSTSLVTFGEQLDRLSGLADANKPLLDKLLAEPALRVRYLDALNDIAERWLTWDRLGPIAEEYHKLITADVAKDTHKPASYQHFVQDFDQDTTPNSSDQDTALSLKAFITQRKAYLLKDESFR